VNLFNHELGHEASKYLIVGAGGFIIDVGIFNLLSISSSQGMLNLDPFSIKAISFTFAVTFTYVANSRWTFRKRNARPEGVSRILRYSLVNVVGLFITLIPLYVSRNVLGFTNLLADNISVNVIGLGLAVLVRFAASRLWVFTKV
jgi:putative flippase GtrA